MTTATSTQSDASTTHRPRLGPRLGAFAVVVVVSIGLPFVFLREGGPSWYHLVFHLIGITVCALGILSLHAVRRAATSRVLRGMTWVSTIAFVGWAVGHTGELVTVLTHGGAHADHALFEHPVHMFFATIAVPSWMLSVVSSLVLLITAGVQAIIRGVRR